MTPEQRAFLQEWEASLAPLRDGSASLLAKSERVAADVTLSDANAAYRRITDRANQLVEKSAADLTLDEAIVRVLQQHPELYDAYSEGLAKAQADTIGTRQDNLSASKDLIAWAESRLEQAGNPDWLRNELLSDPQLTAAMQTVAADTERRARQARVEKAAEKTPGKPRRPAQPLVSPSGLPYRAQLQKTDRPRLSEADVDREIFDILDVPAPDEGALLDEVRKDGCDDTTLKAVAAAARLLHGVKGDLSHETAEGLQDALRRACG